jgi:hypothetical protein
LDQNFPNPFREETVFRFSLPTNEHVELTVYDLLGRRVANLIDRQVPVGIHEVTWATESISSGVYFGKLTQGNETEIISIIKIR